MKHPTRLGTIAAAVAVTAMTAVGSPAHAATVGYAGNLNLWEDSSYRGHLEHRTSYDANFGNDKYGTAPVHSFNDGASSISNRTSSYWKLFRDKNYQGPAVCLRPGSQVSNLKTHGIGDWISSAKKYGAGKPSGCSKTI